VPRPNPGEDKKAYIARAIPEMLGEGRPLKEAQGRAFGFWDTYHGGKPKKKKKGKPKMEPMEE
jgi:hypothetical protein